MAYGQSGNNESSDHRGPPLKSQTSQVLSPMANPEALPAATEGTTLLAVIDRWIPLAYRFDVPTICRFYGILIQMYYNDHDPPHFHVVYNEFKAVIAINDLSILFGDLPPKAIGLVMEWARLHKSELLMDWNLSQQKQPLNSISPLE